MGQTLDCGWAAAFHFCRVCVQELSKSAMEMMSTISAVSPRQAICPAHNCVISSSKHRVLTLQNGPGFSCRHSPTVALSSSHSLLGSPHCLEM